MIPVNGEKVSEVHWKMSTFKLRYVSLLATEYANRNKRPFDKNAWWTHVHHRAFVRRGSKDYKWGIQKSRLLEWRNGKDWQGNITNEVHKVEHP